MPPRTRQQGVAPVAPFPLSPPVVRSAIDIAERVLPQVMPQSMRKIIQSKHNIRQTPTAENAEATYKLVAGLWRDIMVTTESMHTQSAMVAGYSECGDWIKDHLQPFADVIASSFARCRLSEFPQKWNNEGGPTNLNSPSTRLISSVVRQMYPLLTQQQQEAKLVEIHGLMSIYADRCQRFHKAVRGLTSQQFWDFLTQTEQKAISGAFKFADANQNLYVVRAVHDDKNYYYEWRNQILIYRIDGTIIRP
jgi:hypothetical protein